MSETATPFEGGYTNRELGEAIGCHHSMASRIVTGQRLPSIDLIDKISTAFGIPMKPLLDARKKGAAEFGSLMQRKIVRPANASAKKALAK